MSIAALVPCHIKMVLIEVNHLPSFDRYRSDVAHMKIVGRRAKSRGGGGRESENVKVQPEIFPWEFAIFWKPSLCDKRPL